MGRAEVECINMIQLLMGLGIGLFLIQTFKAIRRSYRDPVPPDEQPPTPVLPMDEEL